MRLTLATAAIILAGCAAPEVLVAIDGGPGSADGAAATRADGESASRPDAGPDAASVGRAFAPVPRTIRSTCDVASGRSLDPHTLELVDECTECMCTTYGGRCQRRPGCPSSVCVFADGTVASPGEVVSLTECFVCRCEEGGFATCGPRAGADCPADGCVLPYGLGAIGFGEKVSVSECHECACEAKHGLVCVDQCHPTCLIDGLELRDQFLLSRGEEVCTCDYGKIHCAVPQM